MTLNFELLDAAIEDAANGAGGAVHYQADFITAAPGTEKAEICGTAMCLAGFIGVRSGAEMPKPERDTEFGGEWGFPYWSVNPETGKYQPQGEHIADYAARAVGLSEGQADALFAGGNTLGEIWDMRDYLSEHPDATEDDLFEVRDHARGGDDA